MSDEINGEFCPCCSGKLYSECCLLPHAGLKAENALQLMRSRYSAYALGLYEYIMETTHPKNPAFLHDKSKWKSKILAFMNKTQFNKLEIIHISDDEPISKVTFIAYITQNEKDATFTEESRFEKLHGRWLYLDGKVFPGALT